MLYYQLHSGGSAIASTQSWRAVVVDLLCALETALLFHFRQFGTGAGRVHNLFPAWVSSTCTTCRRPNRGFWIARTCCSCSSSVKLRKGVVRRQPTYYSLQPINCGERAASPPCRGNGNGKKIPSSLHHVHVAVVGRSPPDRSPRAPPGHSFHAPGYFLPDRRRQQRMQQHTVGRYGDGYGYRPLFDRGGS